MNGIGRETHAARLSRLRERLAREACDCALLTNLASIRYLTGFTGTAGLVAVTPSRTHLIVDFRYTEQAEAQCPCPITKREGGLEQGLRSWMDGGKRCAIESQDVTLDLMDRLSAAAGSAPSAGSSAAAGTSPATGAQAVTGASTATGATAGTDPAVITANASAPGTSARSPRDVSSNEMNAPDALLNRTMEWHPCPDLVERLRVIKDEDEIERLAASCKLLEELMQRVLESLRPGVREIDVALDFEIAARKATGRPLPFEPIIASGHRGALPHGVASLKEIAAGDLVVVDIGLELDGYVADMTRTVAVKSADSRAREVHEAVHLANRTAAQGIRVGMTGAQAHALAAGVLEARGLGERFGHGLGHGIGVEIHEDPRLSPLSHEGLEERMVFTIEPGAYIPGWGGVRIEDAGVLRAGGVEVFNRMERGLIVV